MTLAAGAFLHPSVLPTAFRLRSSTLQRNSPLHIQNSSPLNHSLSPSELPRLLTLVNSQKIEETRALVEAGTELQTSVSEDNGEELLLWLTPDSQGNTNLNGVVEDGESPGGLGSAQPRQPWRKINQGLAETTSPQSDKARMRGEELSKIIDAEIGVRSSSLRTSKEGNWRAVGTRAAETSLEQLGRPYYKRQYRPKQSASSQTGERGIYNSGFQADLKKRDSDDATESSSQGETPGRVSDAFRGGSRDFDGVAAGESVGFAKSAVSLAGEPGQTYQRLTINLDLQLFRARSLRQKGSYAEAASLLGQCIRDWPDDGRPYVALGTLLKRLNKVQEARKVFEDGCQAVRGENAYIWQAWAVLEDRTGNTSKARKLFDAATVADKTHAAAWHGWAVLELREGNSGKAKTLLRKGLKFCAPNEFLLQTLALLEVKSGRYEQARSLFGKATRTNSKSAASWLAWALMEANQECNTTAKHLFQRGVEASPKNRYVWQAWALFEAKQGNKERARQLFQRGHELNPIDPVLLQAYGLFEYDCGHLAIARQLFKRGVAVDSQHQPVWIAWGWVESKEGNLEAARELFQRAVSVDSRSTDAVRAFQAWGILEDREGSFGVARVLFKRALQVDSQNVPTWMSWAAMEERQGNAVRADELRNLCLQQRTEVVDETPWDVSLNNIIAPAIDRIKGFLKLEQRFPWSKSNGDLDSPVDPEMTQALDIRKLEQLEAADDDFGVEGFLKDKFPWKYGPQAGEGAAREIKVATKSQEKLADFSVRTDT